MVMEHVLLIELVILGFWCDNCSSLLFQFYFHYEVSNEEEISDFSLLKKKKIVCVDLSNFSLFIDENIWMLKIKCFKL